MDFEKVEQQSPGVLAHLLGRLARSCSRQAVLTCLVIGLSAIASIVYTANSMTFKTDRSDLIDPSAGFQQRWLRYTESFGEPSDIVIAVESNRPEAIKEVLDRLGEQLSSRPHLFRSVLYKVEPGKLVEKGLQYLTPDQLSAGLELLDSFSPILNGRWDLINLDEIVPRFQHQLSRSNEGSESEQDAAIQQAGLVTSSLLASLRDRNDFTNPWPEILPIDSGLREKMNQTVYLLNESGSMGYVMTAPVATNRSFEGASAAIDELRELIARTGREFPDARIMLTGIPVLENDEMRRSQSDSMIASLISLAGVAILMIVGYRGFLHPLLGLTMLAVGMAWSFGYTTAVVGHLNILSVSFAAMLMGLGIDFAIHFLSRYLELRHAGRSLFDAIGETASGIGVGVVTGAVTTSLAFLCASLTEFLGVAELGIIAGGGILLCALAAFTVLPALLAIADDGTAKIRLPKPVQGLWLRRLTHRCPLLVLCGSLALIGGLGYRTFDWSGPIPRPLVRYDHNLLNLQATGLESVEAQKHVFRSSQHSLLYAISLANSPEHARDLKRKFESLPSVHHVEELASRLPTRSPSEVKLLVQGFHAQLARLPAEPPAPEAVNPVIIGERLDEFCRFMERQPDAASQRIARELDEFLEGLDAMSLREQVEFLAGFQYRMAYALPSGNAPANSRPSPNATSMRAPR